MLISETLMDIVPESLTELGRSMHVAASYWGIVLMGLHIGMHWSMIAGRVKNVWAKIFAVIFCGWGMYEFLYYLPDFEESFCVSGLRQESCAAAS